MNQEDSQTTVSVEQKHPLQAVVSPKQQKQPTQQIKKPSMEDYLTICQLGRGSYGEVVLAKHRDSDTEYAIKLIDKRFMAKEKKQYQVFIEKEMLQYLKDHPGMVHLYFTFQSTEKLFFVMEYLDGGDFAEFIKLNQKNLSTQTIQFYLAEIVNILEYLHGKGIAHRDVKPENILITKSRHLKMIDFGTASIYDESKTSKEVADNIRNIRAKYKPDDNPKEELFGREDDKKQRATFVGTAEYVSPELLDEDICQGPADLWALGCICYKMFTGKTPFYDNSEYLVFNNIKAVKYQIPESVPEEAASLIQSLLVRDPSKRLGAGPQGSKNDYHTLKTHPFFNGINFNTIWSQEAPIFKSFKLERDQTFLDPDIVMGGQKIETKKKKSRLAFYGLVQLKVGWLIYRPVDLVLYEGKKTMNLVFYDPETQKSKGKIRLTDNIQVYAPKDGILNIEQDRKVIYTFKEIEHPVHKWLEMIDKSRHEKKKSIQK